MKTLLIPLLILSSSLFASTEPYIADVGHSSIEFKIQHNFVKVVGRFKNYSVTIDVDRAAIENSTIHAEIDIASIDTNQPKRDAQLTSSLYFDAGKFPKMTFDSKSWKKRGENEFDVTGDLSFHGISKSIILNVKCIGFGNGLKGVKMRELSGWEGRTKIKRSDFGIVGLPPFVGEEVDVEIYIEAQKPYVEPAKNK